MAESLKRVCLVFAGGTLAMAKDPETGSLTPEYGVKYVLDALPQLKDIAEFDSVFVTDVDSSNMTPKEWIEIASQIQSRMSSFDGFVVIHGTDTMAYTASALSFLLQNTPKPIILTGSQRPLAEPQGTDAWNNILHAAYFATSGLTEVAVCFGSKLLRGNRATKFSQFDFDAFRSFNYPEIGKIGLRAELLAHAKREPSGAFKFYKKLQSEVCLLTFFPGMDPKILGHIGMMGYKGVVIAGAGPGNLPTNSDFPGVISRLSEQDIAIVVTTQCPLGAANLSLYEVGKRAEDAGAVACGDMTAEAAVSKLMWALANVRGIDAVRSIMKENVAGELSVQ